eukprot:Filipodium_phascolosomae@DN5587_c0_g1_i1.p2
MSVRTLESPWQLSSLLLHERTLDVTLQCGDTAAKAHRCILACQSKVFEEMLYENEDCNNGVISLDSDADTLDLFIAYLYGSGLTINNENFAELFKLASIYQVPHLLSQLDEI